MVDKGIAAYKEEGIDVHGYVCDVTNDMFDKQPNQLAVAEDAIQKQMQLIENLHYKEEK